LPEFDALAGFHAVIFNLDEPTIIHPADAKACIGYVS
jgi:hypothetical protein